MSKDKDPDSPATTSYAWDMMAPKWGMISTLLGGTASMREAGTEYLPKHAEETDYNYRIRLEQNTLFNMFELTLDSMVGRPFSDPVSHTDEMPEEMEEWLKDIDLQGNADSTFLRKWFREGVAKGIAHVLIDMPSMDDETRLGRTLADDMVENRRPYWQLVEPENLIFAASEIRNGVEFLTHVRIYEVDFVQEGFAERMRERIRVIEPNRFIVYEKVKTKSKKEPEWVVVNSGDTDFDFVPLVTFYANKREDLMLTKPPMEDLAFLNIRHWQSTADQWNILTVARFPILAASGVVDSDGQMAIGPRQLLTSKDSQGRFYYVEHDGKAMEQGRQDLMDLENQMAAYGAAFLTQKPGNPTATARALDAAETTATLQDMTVRFMDAANTALRVTGTMMGVEEVGEITISTDFGPEKVNEAHFRALLELRRNRDLSLEDTLLEFQRAGALSDEFDVQENMDRLQEEPTVESPFATGQNAGQKGGPRQLDEKQGRPEGGGSE